MSPSGACEFREHLPHCWCLCSMCFLMFPPQYFHRLFCEFRNSEIADNYFKDNIPCLMLSKNVRPSGWQPAPALHLCCFGLLPLVLILISESLSQQDSLPAQDSSVICGHELNSSTPRSSLGGSFGAGVSCPLCLSVSEKNWLEVMKLWQEQQKSVIVNVSETDFFLKTEFCNNDCAGHGDDDHYCSGNSSSIR